MLSKDFLQFGNTSIDLEESGIYGIFEPYGSMTWHIEMFPLGEENYIIFNALVLSDVFLPKQLSEKRVDSTAVGNDLYEHTVIVNGNERFLQSVDMKFGKWDERTQSIDLSGSGIIAADGDLEEVTYNFKAQLKFKEINIFETSHQAVQEFVNKYLSDVINSTEVHFETVASGLMARIEGRF